MRASSGKFVLRLLPSLHSALREESNNLNCSLNEYCVSILSNRHSTTLNQQYHFIINELVKKFADTILGVILFGSQARDDANDNSDIDILVIMNQGVSITRELYRQIPQNLDPKVSVHFSSIQQDPQNATSLLFECAIDGKILYDPTGSVSTGLEKIRTFVLAGNVRRKVTHGQGFWIRQ